MSKEKRRVPKLRFPGFTEDWEQRKANYIFNSVTDKGYPELPVLSASQELGMVYRDQNGIDIQHDKKNETSYKRVLPGQFVIHLRSFQGGFAYSEVEGITSPAYTVMSFKNSSEQYGLFWKHVFKSETFIKRLETITYGIRDGRSISFSDFKSLMLQYPSFSEQELIGDLIAVIERGITLHQRKLDNLKLKKKALLQKLFPKNGERYPELRFPGFTDAWEQRKLSDILVERNEQQVETNEYPLMSFVQGHGVIPKGERYDRSFLVLDQSKKYKRTELGDFIYSSNNLETGSIGINKTGKAVISPVYSIFYGVSIGDSQFIGIMSLLPRFITKMIRFRQGVVYGQWRIHEKDFLDISILIPSEAERTKITKLILSIEELITLHQRKLDHLQLQKKALLQQMFV